MDSRWISSRPLVYHVRSIGRKKDSWLLLVELHQVQMTTETGELQDLRCGHVNTKL